MTKAQKKTADILPFVCPTGFAENYKGQAHQLTKGKKPIVAHPKNGSVIKLDSKAAKRKLKRATQADLDHLFGVDTRTITMLVKKNPKRPGTKAWKKFDLYKGKKTVQEYLAAGGKRKTIA